MRKGVIIALVVASGGIARAQRTGVSTAQADTERCTWLFENGDYDKAEQACTAALRKDASYVPAWRIYLPVLIAEHKEERAIAEAERAETTFGINDATVLASHGAAILSAAARPAVDPNTQQPNKWARQHARALPYLERAVTLDSEQLTAQSSLCAYWTFDPAYQVHSLAACQTALRKQPNNTELLVSKAWIYHNYKRHAEAQTIGEQVLRLKPGPRDEIKARILIGISQAERGDCANARRMLEPMYELAAKRLERNGAAVALIQRGLYLCPPEQGK